MSLLSSSISSFLLFHLLVSSLLLSRLLFSCLSFSVSFSVSLCFCLSLSLFLSLSPCGVVCYGVLWCVWCVCVVLCCVLCCVVCCVLCCVVLCCVCGVVWCVARLGTQKKKPPCVDSIRPRVYRHHAHMCYHRRAWRRFLFFCGNGRSRLFVWLFVNLTYDAGQDTYPSFTSRFVLIELTVGRMPTLTKRSRASTFQITSARLSKKSTMVTFALDTSFHRHTSTS